MRTATVVVLAAVVALAAAASKNDYTNKWDNIDVDKILTNDRILSQYIKCLMEEGPCTTEGRELKKTLPDALKTGCTKCTEKQKTATDKVLKYMRKNRSRDLDRLTTKYDPDGEFKSKYESRLFA